MCFPVYFRYWPKYKGIFIPNDKDKKATYETYIGGNKAFSYEVQFREKSTKKYVLGVEKFSFVSGQKERISNKAFQVKINDDKNQIEKVYEINSSKGMSGDYEKKENEFNPPKIILQLPSNSKSATWQYTGTNGTTHKCKSSFTSIEIDGEEKRAIKVIDKAYESGKYYKKHSMVKYYVRGVGLWKVEGLAKESTFRKKLISLQ